MLDAVDNSTVSAALNATETCASTGEQVLGTLAFDSVFLINFSFRNKADTFRTL